MQMLFLAVGAKRQFLSIGNVKLRQHARRSACGSMRGFVCTLVALIIISLLTIAYFGVELAGPSNVDVSTAVGSPLVLVWTPIFGKKFNFDSAAACPRARSCKFTSNKRALERADAVVFHAHDTRRSTIWPRFLENLLLKRPPLPRNSAHKRQRFIFASMEAPPSLAIASEGGWWRECEFFVCLWL